MKKLRISGVSRDRGLLPAPAVTELGRTQEGRPGDGQEQDDVARAGRG